MSLITGPFRGEHAFLSNFFGPPIKSDNPLLLFAAGIQANTVEHLFQAAKTNDPAQAKIILEAPTPGKAKRLARNCRLRPDWEHVKVGIMEDLVYTKFKNPTLANRLLNTKTTLIIELNSWHDNFWGICTCPRCGSGRNELGRILMTVRAAIRTNKLPPIF